MLNLFTSIVVFAAVFWIKTHWIRIQTVRWRTRIGNQAVAECGSYPDPDPDQGFMTKNTFFDQKTSYVFLNHYKGSLGSRRKTSSPSGFQSGSASHLTQDPVRIRNTGSLPAGSGSWPTGLSTALWIQIRSRQSGSASHLTQVQSGSETLVRCPPDPNSDQLAWAQHFGSRSHPDTRKSKKKKNRRLLLTYV